MKESGWLTSLLRVRKEEEEKREAEHRLQAIFVGTEGEERRAQNLVFFKAVNLNKEDVQGERVDNRHSLFCERKG